MSSIKEPKTKKAMDTKQKIISKGFELICKKGYHNVTSADIAKFAGVSTGIVYEYFKNKEDIFNEGVKIFGDMILFPMVDIIENEQINLDNLEELFDKMIDNSIRVHVENKQAHEELLAMKHQSDVVKKIIANEEVYMNEVITHKLKKNGYSVPNIHEKMYIIVSLVDYYCHTIVYNKRPNISYDFMKKEIISTIINLMKKQNYNV